MRVAITTAVTTDYGREMMAISVAAADISTVVGSTFQLGD